MLPHTMLGPLMLLSVLPDLYSACPLTLDPPDLEEELGEDITVNCTGPDDGHRGVSWSSGSEIKDKDVATFSVLSIQEIDWNTQAKCTIKVNDSYECSKDLKLKVYKNPASINVRSKGKAVEENLLELECEINNVTLIQNLTVTWYMNNKTMNRTNYNLASSTKNMSSSLTWKVKRDEDGAIFTCEAMLDLGPHGPPVVSNKTWPLSVQYAPKFLDINENIHLNKSGAVTLHCEAMGHPPPRYNWTQDGVIVAEDTNDLIVSQVNETTTYNCTASNYLGSITKKFSVNVMENMTIAAPDSTTNPDLPTQGLSTKVPPKSPGCPVTITPEKMDVQYGGSASANCSTTERNSRGIGWEASTGGTGVTRVTELMWKVEKVKVWTISAECFINLEDGSQCEQPLNITVYKTPDKVQVSPDGNDAMVEGKPHQLKCEIFNVAPVEKLQVNWYLDNKLYKPENQTAKESGEDSKNVSSTMTFTPQKEHNGANFTCEAALLLEQNLTVMSKPYTLDVQYKPRILNCQEHYAGKEGELKLDTVPCKADGNPKPVVSWYHQDTLVNSSKALTRSDLRKYTAKFVNTIGESSTTVDITIEYGPSFSCKQKYNITENGNLGSTCEPEGIPKPNIVWLKNGIKMAVPKLWKRQDSGKYQIEASNKHGKATHTLSINVLYAPWFSMGNSTKEFSPGENVTLDCRAEGNPLPELQWKYPQAANVEYDTRGRQLYVNVTVTGATSSNAGVYSCGATNEVGTVTRTVTLIMKGQENSGNKITWWEILLIATVGLLILVFLSIIIWNHIKKSGQYSFVRASDSIPLTPTKSSVV